MADALASPLRRAMQLRRVTGSSVGRASPLARPMHEPVMRISAIGEGFGAADLVLPTVDSVFLLRGQKMVEITHNDVVYKLQATKLGKLILTK